MMNSVLLYIILTILLLFGENFSENAAVVASLEDCKISFTLIDSKKLFALENYFFVKSRKFI